MKKILIGVISDTHGLLRPEAERFLKGCDHIIHAGDVGGEETLQKIRSLAPATIVRGNVDGGQWARALPDTETVEVGGRLIYVLHNIDMLDLDPLAGGFDVVVYGHSHRPLITNEGKVAYFNPGSIGPRRFSLPVSWGWMEIDGGDMEMGIERLAIGR